MFREKQPHFPNDADTHYKFFFCSESSNINQESNVVTSKIVLGKDEMNMSHVNVTAYSGLVKMTLYDGCYIL